MEPAPEGFEGRDRFWISSHAELWQRVIASTLDFSGVRLRNATMAR
jgi:hypothetical protein